MTERVLFLWSYSTCGKKETTSMDAYAESIPLWGGSTMSN